ncbi:MAG: UDP-N-acetylmuramate dehydrogenase [Actinomycetota bacterium]|nr:UDP-N-acetylmuramate dehydrogenase [Actinomycetota bacterium]
MNLEQVASRLRGRLAGRSAAHFPLARLTTYRLGGEAELFVEPAAVTDLEVLGEVLRDAGFGAGTVPVNVLGRGSNLVVSDDGVEGVVIRLGPRLAWTRERGARGVRAGAATPLPQLANHALRRHLSGAEFLVAIPGSVGGGVRMNAGAHGVDIAGILSTALIFDLSTVSLRERSADQLGLAYRRSDLSASEVVVEAGFELVEAADASIRERMETYRRHRAETQPGAAQNAGSVFKNPPGDSAGRVVEACGLKGFRVGGASVSELHANFFMAGERASSQDVYDLVHAVTDRVRAATGVELETEIRFVGNFRPATRAPAPEHA